MKKLTGKEKNPGRCRQRFIAILVCLLWVGSSGAVAGFSMFSSQGSTFNLTTAGFAWVTTMDEADVKDRERVADGDGKQTIPVEVDPEVETGFTSIDSMLRWAIGHSDPEKLKGTAQEVEDMTSEQLEKRQLELKELMDKVRMKSDADLMKISLADLQNDSSPSADRQRALRELLILVEPIDNAIDLNKIGGLLVVITELERKEKELRSTAAWVLGKASQNNPVVQNQLLHLGALPKLMKMVGSRDSEEAVKALYAVSALIRNFPLGQEAFYTDGGGFLLQLLLSTENVNVRLQKKALSLVADLAEQQVDTQGHSDEFGDGLLKSVATLIEAEDLDTQEKALMAMRSLIGINKLIRDRLRSVCQPEEALERLRLRYLQLILDPEQADYIRDLEVLRDEVAGSLSSKSEGEHKVAVKL